MRLKEYLEKNNLSQNQFARLAHVSEAMVSRILNNPQYKPRINAIQRIVEFTNGDVEYQDFLNAA